MPGLSRTEPRHIMRGGAGLVHRRYRRLVASWRYRDARARASCAARAEGDVDPMGGCRSTTWATFGSAGSGRPRVAVGSPSAAYGSLEAGRREDEECPCRPVSEIVNP